MSLIFHSITIFFIVSAQPRLAGREVDKTRIFPLFTELRKVPKCEQNTEHSDSFNKPRIDYGNGPMWSYGKIQEFRIYLGPTGKVYTVEIFPVEKCSCLIPHAACSHVPAVKTALRMNDSSKAFATTNIGLVRTKARGKAKLGRKQPRPGDIKISDRDDEPVITIEPATDQDVEDTTEDLTPRNECIQYASFP